MLISLPASACGLLLATHIAALAAQRHSPSIASLFRISVRIGVRAEMLAALFLIALSPLLVSFFHAPPNSFCSLQLYYPRRASLYRRNIPANTAWKNITS